MIKEKMVANPLGRIMEGSSNFPSEEIIKQYMQKGGSGGPGNFNGPPQGSSQQPSQER